MKPSPLRWGIAALRFGATAITYIDRQTLSVAAPYIRESLAIDNEGYGYAVGSFLAAYTVMHVVAGRVLDAIGTRAGFALAVAWWSVAAMLHAFSRGVASLCAFRFLLGVGEAGNFPAAIKCVGEWFRESERALATGIFNTGAAIGAMIAPPLVAWLVVRAGWRAAFVLTGALGFLWMIAWLLLYRRPPADPSATSAPAPTMGLARLIRQRPILGRDQHHRVAGDDDRSQHRDQAQQR